MIVNLGEASIRGIEVYVTDSRITKRRSGLYHYEIRHDEDWMPSTIEKRVVVDHYGTVVCRQSLDFLFKGVKQGADYILLNGDEVFSIFESLNEMNMLYSEI